VTTIATVDYLRLCGLLRRTISVDLPAELVARKGKSRPSRARCQRVEGELREQLHAKFTKSQRRPYESRRSQASRVDP
jgi:hypothetical protein